MNIDLKILMRPMPALLVCLFALVKVTSAETIKPAFYLPFDQTLESIRGQVPTQQRGIKFVPGVKGDAVYIGGHGRHDYNRAPLLEYDATHLFDSPSGTVMFWVSPSWDGRYQDIKQYPFPWYTFLSTMGGKKPVTTEGNVKGASVDTSGGVDFTSKNIPPKNDYQRMAIFMYAWLRADLNQNTSAKQKFLTLTRGCRVDWLKDDWWHIALTWDASGWSKLYVNGIASRQGNNYSSSPNAQKGAFGLRDTQRMYVGGRSRVWTGSHRANAAIDELQVFSEALSDEQVWRAYHQVMPLDIVLDQRFFRADQKQSLTLEVSPAERAAQGPSHSWKVKAPSQMNLQVRLVRDADHTLVVQKNYVVQMDSPEDIALDIPPSPVGTYRLTYVLDHGLYHYQKSHLIVSYKQKSAPKATDRPWTLGEPVVQIDTTDPKQTCIQEGESTIIQSKEVGSYRQAGNDKKDRFAYRIPIPKALIGKTTVLRITWPDDRPRSMGLYMYRDIRGDKTRQLRDRLEGGIQSGEEYPLTHSMRTTEYLFFPWTHEYLFSARTMVRGYPAAVAKIELLPVTSRLPKLKLNRPLNMPQRHLGHMDEDQTFEILLNWEKQQRFLNPAYSVDVLERLLDYFDYTGQDTLSYPFLRYDYSLNTKANSYATSNFRTLGWQKLMLDMFAKRGKHLIAMINLWSLPQARKNPDRLEALRQEGYFLINRHGKTGIAYKKSKQVNPLHPVAHRQFMDELDTILHRYGQHPALDGIDLWLLERPMAWTLGNLNTGYGDLTVGKFETDTGIKLPIAADDPDRFGKRYDLLTGRYRQNWIKWRSDQHTRIVREIARHVAATGKHLKLYLTVGICGKGLRTNVNSYENFDIPAYLSETYCLNIKKLKTIPGIQVNLMRFPTNSRWVMHWFNGRHAAINELQWNPAKSAAFKSDHGTSTWNYYRYFESFAKSPLPAEFKAYFENADVKPHGRYFLQDYALSLASVDCRTLLAGAQPLGTSGRDAVTREFAKAFLALPAIPFIDMPGSRDAVVARYAQTPQGTYFYLTNLTWSSVKVSVNLGRGMDEAMNLSSSQVVSASDQKLDMSLKPHEARSFRLSGKSRPVLTAITFPKATTITFNQQAGNIADQIAVLQKHGADTTLYRQRFRKIRQAINAQAFATAHRLIFSKLMADLPRIRTIAEKGYLKTQKKMIASSRYNVNCGSDRYWQLKDGRLFFPDQVYQKGSYGYIGTHKQIGRSIRNLKVKDQSNRVLFASEAYNIEHYRFTVKPGRYSVRVYLKIGYMPKASPGHFVLSIDAENKTLLKTTDVFTLSGKDANRGSMVQVDNVRVTDGLLDLYFKHPAGIDPTARMCNAIEVIPHQ